MTDKSKTRANIVEEIKVSYFGCKRGTDPKTKKLKTTETAAMSEERFREMHPNDFEAKKAALIDKVVRFDFTGFGGPEVTISKALFDYLMKRGMSRTTIRDQWYNNQWVNKSLEDIIALPSTITVDVKEMSESANGSERKYSERLMEWKALVAGQVAVFMTGRKAAQQIAIDSLTAEANVLKIANEDRKAVLPGTEAEGYDKEDLIG